MWNSGPFVRLAKHANNCCWRFHNPFTFDIGYPFRKTSWTHSFKNLINHKVASVFKQHIMKTWEVEVQLHRSIACANMWVGHHHAAPTLVLVKKPPSNGRIEGWVGPRASLQCVTLLAICSISSESFNVSWTVKCH